MNAHMITRNVVVNGKRTTIRLELAVWEAFDEICARENLSRHELCTRIENARKGANRAQAVRATIVNYYRVAGRNDGMNDGIGKALEGVGQLAA